MIKFYLRMSMSESKNSIGVRRFSTYQRTLCTACVRAVHLNLLFNPCGPHVMTNQLLRYFFAFVCSFILIHIYSSFFHWICLQFDKLMAWLMDFTIFNNNNSISIWIIMNDFLFSSLCLGHISIHKKRKNNWQHLLVAFKDWKIDDYIKKNQTKKMKNNFFWAEKKIITIIYKGVRMVEPNDDV